MLGKLQDRASRTNHAHRPRNSTPRADNCLRHRQQSRQGRKPKNSQALSLQALATAAGVSKPYISQIEGGKRAGTAATLKKLAGALGLPVGALVP